MLTSPKKSLSPEEIIQAVEQGVIRLSEIGNTVRAKLDATIFGDIPVESFAFLHKIKSGASDDEQKDFSQIDDFLKNTAGFKKNPHHSRIEESNGIAYFIINTGTDQEIYKIIEQKPPIYILYHPVKRKYMVYKFYGTEFYLENIILLNNLESISPTPIEGYYTVTSLRGEEGDEKNITDKGYYFIGEHGKTQYLGDFSMLHELKEVGKTVYFSGVLEGKGMHIVIHHRDGEIVQTPYIWNFLRKTQSGRNILELYSNVSNGRMQTTYAIFDLDNMGFLLENADECNIYYDKQGFVERITYGFNTQREMHFLKRWLSDMPQKITGEIEL